MSFASSPPALSAPYASFCSPRRNLTPSGWPWITTARPWKLFRSLFGHMTTGRGVGRSASPDACPHGLMRLERSVRRGESTSGRAIGLQMNGRSILQSGCSRHGNQRPALELLKTERIRRPCTARRLCPRDGPLIARLTQIHVSVLHSLAFGLDFETEVDR